MVFPPDMQRLLVDLSLSLPAVSRHPKFAWLSGGAGGLRYCSSGGITDAAPILGKEIKDSDRVPLSDDRLNKS
jgi:hypothetical protein